MKKLAINIVSLFTKLWLKIFADGPTIYTGLFFNVRIKSQKGNILRIKNSETIKSQINVSGLGNEIIATDCLISDSNIKITGNNNKIVIGNKVKLRGATIIIRGSGCVITIGEGTTFGGIRIVNVGRDNPIHIGDYCLFSDNIELWASDTHSIYNEHDEWINMERPIHIGDRVWIGSRVIILKGVKIHEGSIIGIGSVVTKDVPPRVISAGYPSRVIKEGVNWKLDYR